ncbi:sacsin N-terminal ATP-binding-like domain-containing protein [Haloarchaeobius sp. FL176]|uniref:sacsin N-terminal ATP-binding-like domain-containing protein n=1 Tax=Haloarchaeobius sp. FL176 TaxID=2967129 RepID=UPI0021478E01|nr:hypothetical protein [Haloarchaeobius sp. FL176]
MSVELLSETDLYGQWRDRWKDFLTDIEEATNDKEIERKLRDKVTIGNAERRIAGGHEGREILELLQNARDAIQKGEKDRGHVYIGIYDEGVMVANTGSRFDFFNPKVEKAVTMIGETGKGDDDDGQSIGHKGVGLKSILATGDSFEIYTRPDSTSDNVLGVKLSRTYLLGALLSRLGVDVPLSDLVKDIRDPGLQTLLRDHENTSPVSLDSEIRDALSKLPLFNFPVPVNVDKSNDEVVQRAKDLLRDEEKPEQFRTVVFVRYADSQWRELLEQSDISLPDEGGRSLADRPDRIWEYLSHSENQEGLRKETLVQLGGIKSLQLERNSTSKPSISENWSVNRSGDTNPLNSALHHETVEVQIDGRDRSYREVFDQFRYREDTDHDVSLLVGKETTTASNQYPREYPLYLYYPIQNTATTAFPFCLHGRFRVETNRKDLSNNNIEENKSVLKEGLDLIEAVSVETARKTDSEGPYGQAYPWLLLPPVTETVTDDPTTQSELLRWFCKQLYDRLRENPNIALDADDEPASPASTLLHWNDRTLASYCSLGRIETPASTEEEDKLRPLPAEHVLAAYQAFPSRWVDRLRELLLSDTAAVDYTDEVVRDWAATLSKRLTGFDESTVRVNEEDGRNLLYGFVDLVFDCTDGDDDIEELLTDLSDPLEGVYLLPCTIPGEESAEDSLQLVPIERRQSPQGERARGIQSRSVIWDIKSASRTTTTPEAPHPKTSFTVYFFDGKAEQDESIHKLLSLSGRLWGIRAYEGIPSFVRSLLDAFAFGSKGVLKPVDFAFLTDTARDLGQESTDLQVGEGEYLPISYLNSAIQQSEGDQRRNLERRIQLRNCSIQLPKQESPYPIRTTALSDAWQAYLLDDEGDDEEESAALQSLTYPTATWPDPPTVSWEAISNFRSIETEDIGRTLSLLGASSFPNIRVVWMYGDDHPDMRQPTEWNPDVWPEQEFGDTAPPIIQDLIEVLHGFDGAYQRWITAPGFHPQETAGHSSKCSVKLDGGLHETNLASWVWCDDIETLEEQGKDVIELLRRHGDTLLDSLLRTGWSCTNGHMRRDWSGTVPTLFNWQLRQLSVWGSVLTVHDDVADRWSEGGHTLDFAVQAGSSQGAQAARLFPSIDPDVDDTPSEEVLSALGVKSIDSLNSTQAARRLQKLQEVLAVDSLDAGQTRLHIPSGRESDWNQAYTKLLKPLMQRLPDDDPADAEFADGGFLTHFPLLDGDSWISVPVDWLREIAEKRVRYYKDQSPKPWEKHEVSEYDYYVLQHTSEGPFVRMANHFGVKQVDASKPIIQWADAERKLVEDDQLSGHLRSVRQELLERRDLLVASTEREKEDEIRNTAESLRSAIDNLAVLESFPDAIEAQLSDRASGLYQTADAQTGLAFNQSSCKAPPTLSSLAMGLALLVERPTNIATFREALQQDVSIEELETRWERLTFPVDTVRRVLGSELTKELQQRFTGIEALLGQLEDSVDLPTDDALSDLTDADSGVTEATKRWFATGGQPPEILEEYDRVLELGKNIRERLPDEYHFVLRKLFHPTESTTWQTALRDQSLSEEQEAALIRWLLNNSSTLPSRPVDPTIRAGWRRLLALVEVWNNTDVTDLSEVRTWRRRTTSFKDSVDVDWTARAPTLVTSETAPPVLFFLATEEELQRACDEFANNVSESLSKNSEDISAVLTQYVYQDEFPEDPAANETSSREHQEQAFAELQDQLADTEGQALVQDELDGGAELANTSSGSLSVSEGSDSGGGGSRQYTGRGQQAEVYTIVSVLDRLSEWLEHSPRGLMRHFKSQFQKLYEEQQAMDYKWHVENAWQSGLLDILQDTAFIDEEQHRQWRTKLGDSKLSNLPLVRLLNVTQEQGPGFDIIDPFGPLNTDLRRELASIRFAPVEVKAVGGTEPPFHFRLTTNEYRRCKAFVSESDHPYIIRLVYVPDAETPNWPVRTEFVSEKVIEDSDELNRLMEVERFERVVKGGYMNMNLG